MQLITHQTHINKLPVSTLKRHIQSRYDSLTFNTDVPPNIVLVDENDVVTGREYAFVGSRGLLSDLFEEHAPGHPEFARPYEWVSYFADSNLYEVLLLKNNEDGIWILIPEAIVEASQELTWVLTDESQGGLSAPQPS